MTLRLKSLPACIVAAFGLLAFDAGPEPDPPPQQPAPITQRPAGQMRPADLAPPPAPQPPTSTELDDLRAQQSMADSARWMAWLTLGQFALAMIGTIALVLTLRQTGKSIKMTGDSLDLTRQALNDDREGLKIARQGLELQAATAARQLRAYLDVNTQAATGFVLGETPRATIQVLNCGQTPAHRVQVVCRAIWLKKGDPNPSYDDFKQTPLPAGIKVGQEVLIGAGQHIQRFHDAPGTLTAGRIRALRAGTLRLVFYGLITYRDAFEQPHTYWFCRNYMNETGDDWRAGPLKNDAD